MKRAMAGRPIRLLMVDDHALVRVGTRTLLEATGEIAVVGEATCGEEAIALARKSAPDLVLMDVSMPGMGGLETTRKLLRAHRALAVVVLTMHAQPPYIALFMEAGARGYLTKDCRPEEILAGILTVARGGRYISAAVAQQLALNLHPRTGHNPLDLVSQRELQVMMMLIRGCNVSEIAAQLSITSKTVSSHRCNIYEKLGVDNDVALLHLAIRHGLIQPGECF